MPCHLPGCPFWNGKVPIWCLSLIHISKAAKEGMFADVSEYMKNAEVYSRYYEDGYLPWDSYKNVTFREDLDGVYLWQMNVDATDKSLDCLVYTSRGV